MFKRKLTVEKYLKDRGVLTEFMDEVGRLENILIRNEEVIKDLQKRVKTLEESNE